MKYWKGHRFKKHLSVALLFVVYLSVLGYLSNFIA